MIVWALDDNAANVLVIRDVAEDAGHVARVFTVPQEALDYLAHEVPDAMIIDWDMPVIDGVAFITRARKIAPRTRYILYSAQPDTEEFKNVARDVGADGWLSKPYDIADLERVLLGKRG